MNNVTKILKLVLIQCMFVMLAKIERGYIAIGGEFLVIPLIMLVNYLYKEMKMFVRSIESVKEVIK